MAKSLYQKIFNDKERETVRLLTDLLSSLDEGAVDKDFLMAAKMEQADTGRLVSALVLKTYVDGKEKYIPLCVIVTDPNNYLSAAESDLVTTFMKAVTEEDNGLSADINFFKLN